MKLPSFALASVLAMAAPSWAAVQTVTLSVPTMECPVCPITVKKALTGVDGVSKAEVNFDLPFAALAVLKARLLDFEADCLDEQFGADGAHLRLALPESHIDALASLLADLTRGRSRLRRND